MGRGKEEITIEVKIDDEEDATVGFDDLSYLTIPHYDFNGNIVEGYMVVDKEVAEDVLSIFKELYDIQYPIERMELIDKYDDIQTKEFDSLDRSSMGRNNTSCFCYRVVNGFSNLSNHVRGRAIDLNPLINPWVQGSSCSPRNADPYVDREKTLRMMLLIEQRFMRMTRSYRFLKNMDGAGVDTGKVSKIISILRRNDKK